MKKKVKTGRKPTTINNDNFGTGYAKMVTSSKLYDSGLPGAAKKMGREALDMMEKGSDRGMNLTRGAERKRSNAQRMAMGGAMHKMPDGTMMKGKSHGMAEGGKLKMVEKGGKKVPAFAADGVGKMAMGGKVSEYGGKEMYKSKAAMMKHEGSESMAEERKERKMAMGGKVKKMLGGGDILGTISPLAGAITGKGLFGKMLKAGGAGLGLLGGAAALREDAKKKKSPATAAGMKAGGTMKMRGAGAATKGTKFSKNG